MLNDIITARGFEAWSRVSKLEYLTTDEAALYIRTCRAKFDEQVKAGRIRFTRPNGPTGRRLFLRVWLDEYVRANEAREVQPG